MSDSNGDDGSSFGNDSFTETTSQSWFQRLGGAITGILVGLILLPVGGFLLFWNEGRAVQTARSLTEGAGLIQSASSERPDPALEGRLVHVAGAVSAAGVPRDPDLNVTPPAGTLRLTRRVEMYQWQEQTSSETRTRMGGGQETVTTYSYRRVWAEGRIDSSRFRQPDGHQNPEPRYQTRSFNADRVMLGGYRISDAQVNQIPAGTSLAIPGGNADGGRYIGQDPQNPRVGDLRITWQVAAPDALSVIGAQVGDGFGPYATRAGDRLFMIEAGRVPAAAMFQQAQADNVTLTWILRLVGTIVMFVGFLIIFNPLKVLADVIPFIGSIVGFGTGLLAAVLTMIFAPATIAIAWLFYRPLVGIAILALGIALAFGLTRLRRNRPAAVQGKPA
ncbi:TMEM43 family protein [Roseococcus sp. SDR]|uniref:TMEM43 family protein n=1 Tax=Roseococcus sp. SDR TaxID=2835532 RepID=UPI001BCF2222|nr:TMEM43 family protein [Roseococcus sp. SDR]MBS7792088.1 TMEM43 family protein [Roseococcus sp. SDR]MBV1847402.1 TMEM43 family protein [Roseococcus sp. SDR]